MPWLYRLYYRLCADVPWLYHGTGYRLFAYQVSFYDVLSGVPHRGCVLIWCLFMTCRFNIMMGHQQPIATQCLFKSISFRFKVVGFCYGYRSIRQWTCLNSPEQISQRKMKLVQEGMTNPQEVRKALNHYTLRKDSSLY